MRNLESSPYSSVSEISFKGCSGGLLPSCRLLLLQLIKQRQTWFRATSRESVSKERPLTTRQLRVVDLPGELHMGPGYVSGLALCAA